MLPLSNFSEQKKHNEILYVKQTDCTNQLITSKL